jgi:hypothetical protein
MTNTKLVSKLLFVVIAITCISSIRVSAGDSVSINKRPLNIQLQYAGNLGLVSGGIGTTYLKDRLNVYLIYGYLPGSIHGVTVHSFAFKTYYEFAHTHLSNRLYLDYYIGLSVFYAFTKNTYLDYPDYYPDDYYSPNAIHATFYLGPKLNYKIHNSRLKAVSLYTEIGSLDYYLYYSFKTDYVSFWEIWNLSGGLVFTF